MKKITVLILVVSYIINTLTAQSDEQLPSEILMESKKIGVISYMTTLKTLVESKMIVLAKNEEYIKETQIVRVKEINTAYNLLKLEVDRLVNQLSADMINKNKIKYYRKVNKSFVKTDNTTDLAKCIEKYQPLLSQIDQRAVRFLGLKYNNTNDIPVIDEILGIADLAKDIITDNRDFREKKITKMIALMNDLKLNSKKDLIKNTKE